MELVEIVNQKGEPTGQIIDKQEAHSKNLLHCGVIVFIINDNNQILLSKRSNNRIFNPNKWEICGGHVRAGEKLVEAAIRELKEELGLIIKENELSSILYKECSINNSDSHIFYYYLLKCNKKAKEFIIQKKELSEVRWFKIDTIIDLINKNNDSILFTKERVKVFEIIKSL